MNSCVLPSSCQDGDATCRKQATLPARAISEKGFSVGLRKTQIRLPNLPRNDDCKTSHARLPRSGALNVCRRGNVRFFNGCGRPCSDWSGEGLVEIRVRILSECRAHGQKKEEHGKIWEGLVYGGCGEAGSGNGRDSGNGGSGWHWGGDWENEGDQGSNRSCEACFLFLLGVLSKNACSKALIPAILFQLFLQRGLLANADSMTSLPKPSRMVDANGSDTGDEKSELSNLGHEKVESNSSCDAQPEADAVFEVQGGTWRRLLIDADKDEFIVDPVKESDKDAFTRDGHGLVKGEKSLQVRGLGWATKQCLDFVKSVLLPDGYPECVTGDYLEYTLWRMGQNIASQINGVLTTQALLYAVGLGKGAIPTAAAINWVLKDGVGYLSKILLANYGRHFDVHPKGWRLLADLLENASYALELLTPLYPNLFLYLGAAAGAGRSAAGLIQAATRSCFYAGFAAQRNFAEVIAKGEAQGMVSKFLGIALGIAMSTYVGASGPTLVVTFLTVTGVHMFCNLKSYQAVQLRTLNPYRACLVFGEYIRGGVVASVKEVNAAEPIFTEVPFLLFKQKQENTGSLLSLQTKEDAAFIARKLNLGVSFPSVIRSQAEALELFKIYHDEQYVLAERQNTYQALLKEGATSHDLLKVMLQVCYLHQLQNQPAVAGDYASSLLETSHRHAVDNFDLVKKKLASGGWSLSDGLIARPLPYRLLNTPV